MPIHLFIDSSIYDKLYSFQKGQLNELKKLIKSISENKIILYLPQQVRDEVKRDREEKLMEFYRNIDKLIPEMNFPNIPDSKDEINELKGIVDGNKEKILPIIKKLKDGFETKMENEGFLADEIINGLFSVASFIETNQTIFGKAIERYRIGNPPGKNNSFGDATIWESLLSVDMKKEDLHFIVDDKHFLSMLDKDEFCPFLRMEWQKVHTKSKIILYKHIGEFTEKYVPTIKTSDKITEREIQIDSERLNELIKGFEDINKAAAEAMKRWNSSTVQTMTEYLKKMPKIPPIYYSGVNIDLLNSIRKEQEEPTDKTEDELEKKKKKKKS